MEDYIISENEAKDIGSIIDETAILFLRHQVQSLTDESRKYSVVGNCLGPEGGFPVIAKFTRTLAANICRQFFFVINTAASARCLIENFQLISCSQRVNVTSHTTTVVVQDGRMIGWLQW